MPGQGKVTGPGNWRASSKGKVEQTNCIQGSTGVASLPAVGAACSAISGRQGQRASEGRRTGPTTAPGGALTSGDFPGAPRTAASRRDVGSSSRWARIVNGGPGQTDGSPDVQTPVG